MFYKSFLKIYFLYVLDFDYDIYKNLKLNNFVNYFLLMNYLLSKKNNVNLISEQNFYIDFKAKFLFVSNQLFQFNFFNKKFEFFLNKNKFNIKNNYINLIFNFLDNLFIYSIYLFSLNNKKFIFNLNNFLLKQTILRENFLFNFKIKFYELNKKLKLNLTFKKLN